MEQENRPTQIIFNFGPINGNVIKQEIHLRESEDFAPESSSEEKEETEGDIPEVLLTLEAQSLLDKFKAAGILNERLRPMSLSGAERGVLAAFLSDRLGLKTPWQTFGRLWGEKPETLRRAQARGVEQKKTIEFQDMLKEIAGR